MANSDPPTLEMLVELRTQAGLSQDEAARCLGLEGKKRRQSISDWETGKSRPDAKRRASFLDYLLDTLLLRRDPQLMADIWTHIAVQKWDWKPLDEEDLRRFYRGGIPPVLLRKQQGEAVAMPAVLRSPPQPDLPPNIDQLIDRPEKIAAYASQLATEHLAVIVGMPGTGKTSLASMLVQQTAQPQQIFWHRFRGNSGATDLMWKLAGFLFWAGEEWPWIWLQNASQSHGQPLNPTIILDTVYDLLLEHGYVLCLDDVQYVEQDPMAQEFGRKLRDAAQRGALSLVITARSLPSFLQGVALVPLDGMSLQETRQLFIERRMPPLGGDLLERLRNRTEGNPQLLELAIVAVRQGEDPQHLVNDPIDQQAMVEYLFDQVDSRLDTLDRQVMIAIALLDPAATRKAIEAVLPSQRVSQSLVRLGWQQLLHSERQNMGQVYHQHATVQAYYLQAASVLERQQLHRLAGEYFEREAGDWLYAASHFLEAREDSKAARLATLDVWLFINQGRARQLAQVLDRFTKEHLDLLEWAAVGVSRGEVHQFLYETDQARGSYQLVLDTLARENVSQAVRELRARALLGMGDLLQHESLPAALQQLQAGLAELGDAESPVRAELLIRIGTVCMALGRHQEALQAAQQGLALLSVTPSALRMRGLITQGAVYSSQGDVARGQPYTQEALKIARQLQDRFRMLSILSNSGLENEITGKWQDAKADYESALAIAKQIGSEGEEAKLANNLGVLHTAMGRFDLALAYLARAKELAEDLELHDFLPFILTSLGDLYIHLGDWPAAEEALAEAERAAQQPDTNLPLAEAYFLRADLYRATGRIQEARELARRAIDVAHELDLALEEGKAWRAFGQALLAGEQAEQAIDAFQRSLTLLSKESPYEAARTQVQWGLALLREARAVFARYGARQALEAIDAILQAG